jgi:hypothetical protein
MRKSRRSNRAPRRSDGAGRCCLAGVSRVQLVPRSSGTSCCRGDPERPEEVTPGLASAGARSWSHVGGGQEKSGCREGDTTVVLHDLPEARALRSPRERSGQRVRCRRKIVRRGAALEARVLRCSRVRIGQRAPSPEARRGRRPRERCDPVAELRGGSRTHPLPRRTDARGGWGAGCRGGHWRTASERQGPADAPRGPCSAPRARRSWRPDAVPTCPWIWPVTPGARGSRLGA